MHDAAPAVPVLYPEVERGEIVHAYGAFMRSDSEHPDAGRELLAYLGSPASQEANAAELHRINAHRGVDRTLYTGVQQRALKYLSEEVDVFVPLLEFGMRPEMASAALQAFAAFWSDPQDIDGAIGALERARRAAYGG